VFALSRTGMERSHIKSCEITDLLGEVIERFVDYLQKHTTSYAV